jgi:hypothetical protein
VKRGVGLVMFAIVTAYIALAGRRSARAEATEKSEAARWT